MIQTLNGPLLTAYQCRIISLLAAGHTNREIGAFFGVTEQAIKNRMRSIYNKTGMGSRVELALWYESHKVSSTEAEECI